MTAQPAPNDWLTALKFHRSASTRPFQRPDCQYCVHDCLANRRLDVVDGVESRAQVPVAAGAIYGFGARLVGVSRPSDGGWFGSGIKAAGAVASLLRAMMLARLRRCGLRCERMARAGAVEGWLPRRACDRLHTWLCRVPMAPVRWL